VNLPTKHDQGRKVEVTFKDGSTGVGILVIHRIWMGSDIWYVYLRNGDQIILVNFKDWNFIDT